jgi:hypothetical protein
MTTPSSQSATASPMGGRELSSLTRLVEVVEARRKALPHSPARIEQSDLHASLQSLLRRCESLDSLAADQRHQAIREKQARYAMELKRDDLMGKCNLPDRHRTMLMSPELRQDGPWGEAWQTVQPKVGVGSLLVLVGLRGRGKTQLAAMAVAASCAMGRSALYTEAAVLFMEIRDSYRDGGSELAVFKKFSAPKLLVIDQMEERKHSEAEDRALFTIINRRYNDCYDTILVSNETPEHFAVSIGPSISDRIAQTGEYIVCDWGSFRSEP